MSAEAASVKYKKAPLGGFFFSVSMLLLLKDIVVKN